MEQQHRCLKVETHESKSTAEVEVSLFELGSGDHGCAHYRRRCKIRAPCCNELFVCRHCHNELKNSMDIAASDRHDIPRHDIVKVICSLCNTEQDAQQNCIRCGVCMGKYFCSKCNFFDDDVSKNQYHCDECGICRTGGRENFFHCFTCGCCYSNSMKDTHKCVEGAMHHNCPICFEFLFDSMRAINVLPCGHTIHMACLSEMNKHNRYSCPVCSKSIFDMTTIWEKMDQEIAKTPMPDMYKDKKVWILCNDCSKSTNANFHAIAHKCLSCNSYNTRQIREAPGSSCTSRLAETVM